ncbi:MAG: DUF1259 domain-containing protein [Nitrososphaera sp.]
MAITNLLLTVATVAIAGIILFCFNATVSFWDQQPSAFAQTPTGNPLNCSDIASRLGGMPVPNGPVCDVVVVRQSPQIIGSNGINLTQFTLMNSVLEFTAAPSNVTTGGGQQPTSQQVYVMGDFALLETEMNGVLAVVKDNGWTVTGIHNHMINETPKTTFMHWEARGNLDTIIDQANAAFNETSIKG